ncbi:hypothetical protein LCL89_04075 [Halobacillus yeomjeoni]|uniref:hypothetical protein n=1 Tax=Halobacillus yeomjeoni TaxID=311194 RepID=UPI001CD24FE0|nr:hypothetical protein [Halobacillus yeomjeoni]MCA0983225.1 hypothetical protein [Halobacillus yeomjeoni]
MCIRFLFLLVCTAFITGCESQDAQTLPLVSMVEEKKPIGSLEITQDKFQHNASEKAETTRQAFIDRFESIVKDVHLSKVEYKKIKKWHRQYERNDTYLTITVANSENSKNVFFMDVTDSGEGLLVSFENGESTDIVYQLKNGDGDLYEKIHALYTSIHEEKSES